MHLASHTFKFWWKLPNTKPRSLLYFTAYTAISQCRTSKYGNNTIVSPSRTEGHTITWRSSLWFFVSLEREKQQHNWHMVWTKVTPRHVEVWPLKCIVYITWNPVTFVIQRHHELFLLDQKAWEQKHSEAYKRHIHRPPTQPATTAMPKNTAHSRCHQTTTIYRQRWCFRENIETLVSYNVRNDGAQQDCLYTEQGHLMTPTMFMTHSMATDPRKSVVVSWTPVRLSSMLQPGSLPLCPLGSPLFTSS